MYPLNTPWKASKKVRNFMFSASFLKNWCRPVPNDVIFVHLSNCLANVSFIDVALRSIYSGMCVNCRGVFRAMATIHHRFAKIAQGNHGNRLSRYLSFCPDFFKINFKLYDVTAWLTKYFNTHIIQYLEKWRQSMTFGQLIECNMRNIFLEKNHTQNVVETLVPDPFLKSKNWASLDQ